MGMWRGSKVVVVARLTIQDAIDSCGACVRARVFVADVAVRGMMFYVGKLISRAPSESQVEGILHSWGSCRLAHGACASSRAARSSQRPLAGVAAR